MCVLFSSFPFPLLFAGFDLVKCEDPGIPNYGYKIRDEGHFIDTVILYSCNPGYTMHGSGIMTCLSGDRRVWDKPLPTCIGNMVCCSEISFWYFRKKKNLSLYDNDESIKTLNSLNFK